MADAIEHETDCSMCGKRFKTFGVQACQDCLNPLVDEFWAIYDECQRGGGESRGTPSVVPGS